MKLFNVKNLVARFRKDEEGATLVEYAIALLVAVGVGTVVVQNLSPSVSAKFTAADDCLNGNLAGCQ
ncbi:hypothetical protein OE699_04020 [Sedimentimonas flavescens]|uniref:Pilus assembly protein Flp/PilA n=1 Tax=Sedimentimonas flavescens TaxID=2851012 RepID=A0ABT2ZXI0_9RHOB|nr:hypothetical protein [Sedimentimonas flavescens]MCV2878010.1 hypothetical protein [Sedimentimonas flavescens]